MAVIRLTVCVAGVYAMFLLWAIAQERLSASFASTNPIKPPERFKSVLFLNTLQSIASVVSSAVYMWIRRPKGQTIAQVFGLSPPSPMSVRANRAAKIATSNGVANGHNAVKGNAKSTPKQEPYSAFPLLLLFLQCAIFVSLAAPFGFAALSHISYPTMVLGKSCKLVPVMLMNVILYRRAFAPHKYLVVALVTLGITCFVGLGKASASSSKHSGSSGEKSEIWGIFLLLINLIIDGVTNSTQDEIFAQYKHINGQQMMFWMNLFASILTSSLIALPLPPIPIIRPSPSRIIGAGSDIETELASVFRWIRDHPGVVKPLGEYALTGAMGQLFIFETLQHFGSLTLTTVTLTRKLFTMLLSVIIYKHTLTAGQWLGAAIVFAGIGVEAWVKRKEVHAKKVLKEQEKAKLKSL